MKLHNSLGRNISGKPPVSNIFNGLPAVQIARKWTMLMLKINEWCPSRYLEIPPIILMAA